MFSFESSGSFSNLERYLLKAAQGDIITQKLNAAGQAGVNALSNATPMDSGETRGAWSFKIKSSRGRHSIEWTNSHKTTNGDPVAILLQYGHGTGTGGYVQGRDYINPAMRPIFDKIADDVWKAVTSA